MILVLALLFSACAGIQTNEANTLFYPGGSYTEINFNAASLACTGTCSYLTTYRFAGGEINLAGGATFSTAAELAVTTGARGIFMPTGASYTFVFDEAQQAVGMDMWVQSLPIVLAATSPGLPTVDRSSTVELDKMFFSVDAPYTAEFTEFTLTAKEQNTNSPTLSFPTFIFGKTGYECIGNEIEYPCKLVINLENLPETTTDVQILHNNDPKYTLTGVGNRTVVMCVPEDPSAPFDVIVTDNVNAKYDTRDATANRPDCPGNMPHMCFLDPRALLPVPIGCLPEPDLLDHVSITGVALSINLHLFVDGNQFRELAVPSVDPVLTVLAVPEVYPALRVNGNSNRQVRTELDYDCTKATTGAAPFEEETCVYPKFGNSFRSFPKLTGEIVVRAKCSSGAQPPMATDVDLLIVPQDQPTLEYKFSDAGNVDTSVCVVAFGTYDISGNENGADTGIVQALCSVSGSGSTCNGTPIDIVSAIFTNGCSQPEQRCPTDPQVTNPSAGGDSNGQFEITLRTFDLIFRKEIASPYVQYATCVLNLQKVSVTMDVSPDVSVSALYDCTERETVSVIHPTENRCHRLDTDGTILQLFQNVTVDLTGLEAGSVNYQVNSLASPDGAVYFPAALAAFPAGSFCDRGGSVDNVCVPAVGASPVKLPCGSTYLPAAIQVVVEECGAQSNTIEGCSNSNKKRDNGLCVRASVSSDCSEEGSCSFPVTNKLCIWDLLYLDSEYAPGSEGVVVELSAPDATLPLHRWTHQGGSPQTYTVLKGFLKIKITENPGAGPSPWIESGAIACGTDSFCSYNDFLAQLDIKGTTFVSGVECESDEVQCSAISYADNYNSPRHVLNGVTVSLTYGDNTTPFRPVIALGSSACSGRGRGCRVGAPAVVLKTTSAQSYGAEYTWGTHTRQISDLRCIGKKCSAVPCLVRWAAIDPDCPDLRRQIAFTPQGVVPDSNDDPHRNKYKYSTVIDSGTAPGGMVDDFDLCSQDMTIGSTNCTVCRDADLDIKWAPQGFENHTNFHRYFLLAQDEAYTFKVTAGCGSVEYQLNCPVNVEETGRKQYTSATNCTGDHQTYWHACSWIGLNEQQMGPEQYWRSQLSRTGPQRELPTPVTTEESCLASNDVTGADSWVPLSPYTIISVDLTHLPNGDNTDSELSSNSSQLAPGSQKGYRGASFKDDSHEERHLDFYNPFELSVCCDSCSAGVATKALLEQKKSGPRHQSCPPYKQPRVCGPTENMYAAGGYDHIVCVLAGVDYSIKVSERFRNEERDNFLDLNPESCPEKKNTFDWTQAIHNCRPTECIDRTPTSPIRYDGELFYNVENKLVDNIDELETYSTNYRCAGDRYSHTLLRPNRQARPAESDIPYIKANTYEWRINALGVTGHSDPFACEDNLASSAGRCFAEDNDLSPSPTKKSIGMWKPGHAQD